MGYEEEQAEDELREAVAGPPLLLRQEYHPQDCRQKVRVVASIAKSKRLGL